MHITAFLNAGNNTTEMQNAMLEFPLQVQCHIKVSVYTHNYYVTESEKTQFQRTITNI